jgi:gas vesicle protein
MQLSVDVSFIVGLLGIASGIISYVTAGNKMRFEVDLLKKENERQFELIEQNRKDIVNVKENGSLHSEGLKSRVEKLEEKMQEIDEKLAVMTSEIKSIVTKLDILVAPVELNRRHSRGTR